MGCTASAHAHGPKNTQPGNKPVQAKTDVRHLKLKKTGLRSVDLFVDQVEDTVERFAKLTDDVEAKRHKFEHATGF